MRHQPILTAWHASVKLESMNIEETRSLERRAAVHGALADVTRLQIVDALALSDRSSSELGSMLSIPSNLLSHHLNNLERAGLVARRRSEGDGRRTYVSLNAQDGWLAADTNAVPIQVRPVRIVFVCTANTARSHLAAAAWRQVSGIPTVSAGTHTGDRIHPGAFAAADRRGLELPDIAPRNLGELRGDHDLIVTVCDRAHEELKGRDWAHWSIPDPVPAASARAFDEALEAVAARVARLAERVAAA